MNQHEAETKQFCALVAKGHPVLAVAHSLLKTRGVQWSLYGAAASLFGITAGAGVLKYLV